MFRLAFAAIFCASPALADFTICNDSGFGASVAVGYKQGDNFVSEGWWNSETGDCVTPLPGQLRNRYYYLRVESDEVEYPDGDYTFCTTSEAFTIIGDENCGARGYDTTGFIEVDTGDAREWVFTLNPAYDSAPTGGASSGGKKSGGSGGSNEVTQEDLEAEYQRLYALVYGDLQGFWVDADDDAIGLRVDDTRLTDFFAGVAGGRGFWSLADTCQGAGGAGPVLIINYDDFPNEPLCWVIDRLSYREAVFSAVNGGTFRLLKAQ